MRFAECFPAGTVVGVPGETGVTIERVSVGETVRAFDPTDAAGGGDLVVRNVSRLFENVTTEWVKLTWIEGDERRELTTTPGHHFLDEHGGFPTIAEMLERGGGVARIVLEDGSLAEAAGELIVYSEATAHLYEQAQKVVHRSEGGLALKPEIVKGWKTYNFEVEDFHTYIAGGVRVHNISEPFAHNFRGVDDIAGTGAAVVYTGNNSGFLIDGYALDRHYDNLGGSDGAGSSALGWGLSSTFATYDTYGSAPAMRVAYAAALRERDVDPHSRIGIWGAFEAQNAVSSGTYDTTSGQVFGPSSTGFQGGTIAYFAEQAWQDGQGFFDAWAAAGGNPYSDDAFRAYDQVIADWNDRQSGGGGSPSYNSGGGSPGGSPTYQIASGDTLSEIARDNNTTVDDLLAANPHISNPDRIYAGDRLTLPGGGQAPNSSNGSDGSEPGGGKGPILLDLDGDGVEVTPLTSSNIFFDWTGNGRQHRTAWAGEGDGILVRDDGNDGVINQRNEVDFTEWDVTAETDMEALRNIFDTDGDGKLDSGDDDWSLFKVLVTNADGTTSLKTLSELDITDIDLTSNNQERVYADGSRITGETTFSKGAGGTGAVADAMLIHDLASYIVTETVTNNQDGSTTVENLATRADGSVANRTISTTSADGSSRTIRFDDDGDGVDDRYQTIDTVTNGNGSTTRTMESYDGSGTILLRSEVTDTSADGLTITISSDFNGSGTNNQVETRVTDSNGDLTVTLETLNDDGSTRSEITTETSSDGHSISVETDATGDGVINATREESTSIDGNGKRTETVTNYAGNATQTANRVGETVTDISADGTSRTVTQDLDGDGDTDLKTVSTIVHNVDGSTTTTETRTNGDASSRDRTITELSADGHSKTIEIDADGDSVTDATTSDVKVFNVDGSTTQTVTRTSADDTKLSETVTTWSEDGETRTTNIDSDGDGNFDQVIVVAPVSGESVETASLYSADGNLLVAETVTTTSADGLTQTIATDADGDGDDDSTVVTTKVVNQDGSSTTTTTTKNGDGTIQIGKMVVTVSADGLSITRETFLGTDTSPSRKSTDVTVLNQDDSTTRTVTNYLGTNEVETGHSVTTISADKLTVTTSTYIDDHTDPALVSSSVTASDGSRTVTTSRYSTDGSTLVSEEETTISADGLTTTTKTDADADTATDGTTIAETDLNTDGTTTFTTTRYAGTGTTNKVSETVVDTSVNGLTTTTLTDLDGDGDDDAKVVSETVLNNDGSTTVTTTSYRGSNFVQSGKTVETVSDDGLTQTRSVYLSDNTSADEVVKSETALEADGSTIETVTTRSGDNSLLREVVTDFSGDGLSTTVTADLDGDGVDDRTIATTIASNGVTTETVSRFDGVTLDSGVTRTVSADGLTTTSEFDDDGDNVVDRSKVASTVLNADGSQVTTVSDYDAADVLLAETEVTTSADGRSVTTEWDVDGDGNPTRSRNDVTVHNANGSTTRTVSHLNGDASLHDRSITIESADGLTVTTTHDVDGDGTVDQTVEQVTRDDGSIKVSRMDGTVTTGSQGTYGNIGGRYETTDADGLTSVVVFDSDGDGYSDVRFDTETELATDGSSTTTRSISSVVWTPGSTSGKGGSTTPGSETITLLERQETETSADGLTVTSEFDLNGDGTFTESRVFETVHNADGTKKATTTTKTGTTLVSTLATTLSADGATVTHERDADGTGSVTETSVTDVVVNADGSRTETVTNTDGTSTLISKFETTTSADGQTITIKRDPEGAGSYVETRTTETFVHADGGTTRTETVKDASDNVLSVTTIETSGDGRVVTSTIDSDGDGDADQVNVTTRQIDGSSTLDFSSHDTEGNLSERLTSTTSFDGRDVTSEKDLDGDGNADRTITRSRTNNTDGSTVETVKTWTTDSTPVLLRKSTTNADADGRSTKTTVDVDGDGDTDETITESRNIDGSVKTTITRSVEGRSGGAALGAVVWTSEIEPTYDTVAASVIKTVRSDGLEETVQADYDGNGTYEHEATWKTHIDGSRSATLSDVDGSSNVVATGTQTISADGLTNTLSFDNDDDGNIDRIEEAVTRADGSVVKTITHYNGDASLNHSDIRIVSLAGQTVSRTILGTDGDDSLVGGNGDDTLIGGSGADALDGGAGADLASYSNATSAIVADLDDPTGNTGDAAGDSYVDIEGIVGSDFDDQLSAGEITEQQGLRAEFYDLPSQVNSVASVDWDVASDHQEIWTSADKNYGTGAIYTGGPTDNVAIRLRTTVSIETAGTYTFYLTSDDGSRLYLDQQLFIDHDGPHVASTKQASVVLAIGALELETLYFERTGDSSLKLEWSGPGLSRQVMSGSAISTSTETGFAPSDDLTLRGGEGDDILDGGLAAVALFGEAGSDTLNGGAGDDVLDGGSGADTLKGQAGSDTYKFGAGSGNDLIVETDGTSSDTDTIELVDLNPDDVTLRRFDATYWDLQVIVNATGETLTVQGQFWPHVAPDDESIEKIVFADGTEWDKQAIDDNTWLSGTTAGETLNGDSGPDRIFGDAGDDTLGGNGGDDTFDGGAGDDTIWGDGGSNTILFGQGSGNDLVLLSGGATSDVDTVQLVDLNPDDVTLRRFDATYWDLQIIVNATGETLTVQGQFWPHVAPDDESIEKIVFANGTEWDKQAIDDNTWLSGTTAGETLNGDSGPDRIFGDAGDDTLGGNGGDDTFDGGAGDDTIWGDGGSNTILFGQGSGNDLVLLSGGATSDVDTVQLVDLNPDDVTLRRFDATYWDLEIVVNATGETLTVQGQFWPHVAPDDESIEKIVFANGTEWDKQAIAENTWYTGTTGDDWLPGTSGVDRIRGESGDDDIDGYGGDDIIEGGSGDDGLWGSGGDDAFVFKSGFGHDTIADFTAGASSDDVVELNGISGFSEYADVLAAAADDGSDTTITVDSNNTIVLEGVTVSQLHQDDFRFVA